MFVARAGLSCSSVWCPTAPITARDTGSCKYWCCLKQDLFHHNCQCLGKRRKCWWKKSLLHFSLTLKLVGATNCCLDLCLISLMICARFKRIVNPNFNYCMIYSFSCYSKPFSVEHKQEPSHISFLYSDSYCHHDYQALKGQNKTNQQTNKHHKTL